MEKQFIIKQRLVGMSPRFVYISKNTSAWIHYEVGVTTSLLNISDKSTFELDVPFYKTPGIEKTDSIEKPLLESLEKFKELLRKEKSKVATKSLGCSRCHVEFINQIIEESDLAQGFCFEAVTRECLTA